MEDWLDSQMAVAQDPNYADYTDLPRKVKAHALFEAELAAHRKSSTGLAERGQAMVAADHLGHAKIQDRLGEFGDLAAWM